jgi:hypothetical protein
VNRGFLLASSLGFLSAIAQTLPAIAANQTETMDQVTSVSQLADVQPTDWAFQALQSLVERYGCIAGYADGTFRGNRAVTRYELAAALNACLDRISDKFATQADLATLKRLQVEFAAELVILRGRVDTLEGRTAELEANQFSTTTKLEGDAIIAPQFGKFGEAGNPTMIARARLNFNTSFNGEDLLFTQLEMGNEGQDIIGAATAGSPFAEFSNPGSLDYADVPQTVNLSKFSYTFKPASDLAITVGPLVDISDYIDPNSYANDEAADFSSGFFINNPLIITSAATGAGAVINWNLGGGPFSLRAAYVAASATNALANEFAGGLFGDPYQGTVEVEYATSFSGDDNDVAADDSQDAAADEDKDSALGDDINLAVRLQYTNAAISDVEYNNFGINAEATFGRFGIFGRYGFGNLDGYGSRNGLNLNPHIFMAGVGVKDLFVPGSLLGLAAGQPFIEGRIGNATQTNYEAFYRLPVNDNITVTPVLMVVTDGNNNSNSPTIYQGVLRTVFFF